MALGIRQRESLDHYADILKRQPEIVRLQITIESWRRYTREQGGGSGMPITITCFECYEEGEYRLKGEWIANARWGHTAIDKGKEIARYLVAAGCPKERIKIGKKER